MMTSFEQGLAYLLIDYVSMAGWMMVIGLLTGG